MSEFEPHKTTLERILRESRVQLDRDVAPLYRAEQQLIGAAMAAGRRSKQQSLAERLQDFLRATFVHPIFAPMAGFALVLILVLSMEMRQEGAVDLHPQEPSVVAKAQIESGRANTAAGSRRTLGQGIGTQPSLEGVPPAEAVAPEVLARTGETRAAAPPSTRATREVAAGTELGEEADLDELQEDPITYALTLIDDGEYESEDLDLAWTSEDMSIDLGEVQSAMQREGSEV